MFMCSIGMAVTNIQLLRFELKKMEKEVLKLLNLNCLKRKIEC